MPFLAILLCLVTGALAARKGYNFFLWVLTGGIIGLIVLAFLPFTTDGERDPDGQRVLKKRKVGNIIGGVLSALFVLFVLVQLTSR